MTEPLKVPQSARVALNMPAIGAQTAPSRQQQEDKPESFPPAASLAAEPDFSLELPDMQMFARELDSMHSSASPLLAQAGTPLEVGFGFGEDPSLSGSLRLPLPQLHAASQPGDHLACPLPDALSDEDLGSSPRCSSETEDSSQAGGIDQDVEQEEEGTSQQLSGDVLGGFDAASSGDLLRAAMAEGTGTAVGVGGSASEDEEGMWHSGFASSGSGSSLDFDMQPRYCVNCVSYMDGDICLECAQSEADTAAIFDAQPRGSAEVRPSTETVLAFDEAMALHAEGRSTPHPERPDRIRAVIARLLSSRLAERCTRVPARQATRAELQTCHSPEVVLQLQSACERLAEARGEGEAPRVTHVTPDTYANQHTFSCAAMAAGACVDIATAVARGNAANGAAIVRPPGHHAESNMAMGFCFFNNAGVAARAAQAAGAERVLILDWDVHHGNGTQHIFDRDDSVLYVSIHRHDHGRFYPGTGAAVEVGSGRGRGFTVNVAWPQGGMGDGDYLAAFNHLVLPIALEFNPHLIIVSAGFDAALGDPIGGCRVRPETFGNMTQLLKAVAPLVLLLEGGYNLTATAAATEACLRVLLGEPAKPFAGPEGPSRPGSEAIREAIRVQAQQWRCLRALLRRPQPPHHDESGVPLAAALAAAGLAASPHDTSHDGLDPGASDDDGDDSLDCSTPPASPGSSPFQRQRTPGRSPKRSRRGSLDASPRHPAPRASAVHPSRGHSPHRARSRSRSRSRSPYRHHVWSPEAEQDPEAEVGPCSGGAEHAGEHRRRSLEQADTGSWKKRERELAGSRYRNRHHGRQAITLQHPLHLHHLNAVSGTTYRMKRASSSNGPLRAASPVGPLYESD